MARGGYQKPSGPKPPSGPGKFSQRSDGNQPIRTAGLDDPSVQYGDVQQMREGQRVAPLPMPGSMGGSAPAPNTISRPRGGLPDFMTQGESSRPAEPGTAGLSTGPGPGPEILPTPPPDPREQVLQFLWQRTGNEDTLAFLNRLRDERAAAAQQGAGPVAGPSMAAPPVVPGS